MSVSTLTSVSTPLREARGDQRQREERQRAVRNHLFLLLLLLLTLVLTVIFFGVFLLPPFFSFSWPCDNSV